MNKYIERDPWDLLNEAHDKIHTLTNYYNDLGTAHNNLVSNCQRLEKDLNQALEAIQSLQQSHITVLNHLDQ